MAAVQSLPVTPAPTKAALVATLVLTAAGLAAFIGGRPETGVDSDFAAPFLWLFSGLFLARVAGQLIVRARSPRWLPPTEQWNLTPYHLLLPVQLAILAAIVWIDVEVSRGSGFLATPHRGLGVGLVWFAYVYAAAMAIRYIVRMSRQPNERWFGGTIPIVFHCVLASYLFVLGSFHASY